MKRKRALLTIGCLLLCGCGHSVEQNPDGMLITGHMDLQYAEQFSVDTCADGCAVIHIGADSYLLVPENTAVPEVPENMTILQQPVENVYIAASDAMDLFDAAGALDAVTMTSTKEKDWTLPRIRTAMQQGKLDYIGKYSAPDYEMLAESGCQLAVENTMIYHNPAAKEQIEALGIPVLVERSSMESHPLGRMEWMRLYGLIFGKEQEAEQYFAEKQALFQSIESPDLPDESRMTCAFFSVSPNGYVNIRKPGDYISKMIELAGGRYVFTADQLHVDDNALSTMNIQMEAFYETACDADCLIYNSTVNGQLNTLSDLTAMNPVFQDFRAVQLGNVWCTEQNLFQQTTGAADMIADFNRIISGQADDDSQLTFLHKLN